ncbi:precorrin-6y C5,15-methyltransferase (decarboxylating) subunit CbiE [Anaerocolumna sedimenticola]|uniref:Precorrin-6y C5,15-methyltransferase (Decarboxylating) subunit CbiE n=1 Tax=Anaerocolumna sedimenticola TaxID=2696063 RepID=A0A6P1TLF6_9FIRM|nr:precorrin-6y C5,15-methyltransferase (decarboxylating) subunit CbiE [Anaerocolumna sedimenticola]QHQ61253.1 precorrin-6y C5,15-methyltransferase (decarboxylating) subunit CbiE [Anaerocolumna sedimenticola]
MKDIFIVGVGMGNINTLTIEGKNYIDKAEVLIGAKRMVKAVNAGNKPFFHSFDGNEIVNFIQSSNYQNYVVLMSGDTGFYSGTASLLPMLKEYEVKVIPGITTVSYFCSKIKFSWEDACLLSLHGREENIVLAVRQHIKTFALTDGRIDMMCRKLTQAGLGFVQVYVGENLSYENERIIKGTAVEFQNSDFAPLSAVFIVNPDYETQYHIGIPDDEFIRGMVPMTKSEIRAIILSKLKLKEDSILYDIGAGTGSVSIEMAFLAKKGRVYAIEQKEEAIQLIKKNQDKFQIDNLRVIPGTAPEVMEKLEKPDMAFIGGSKGNMEDIIQSLLNKNPGIRLVISAIALETLTEVLRLMKEFEFEEVDVVQAAISKTKEAGSYHMLMGQNPVFIISGRGKTS